MATPEEIGAGIGAVLATAAGAFGIARRRFSGKAAIIEPPDLLTGTRHEELCELAGMRIVQALNEKLEAAFEKRDKALSDTLNGHLTAVITAIKENGSKKP